MSEPKIKFWYWSFKFAQKYIKGDPHSGKPSSSRQPQPKCWMHGGYNQKKPIIGSTTIKRSGNSTYFLEGIQPFWITHYPFFTPQVGFFLQNIVSHRFTITIYNPNLILCNIWLFSKLKLLLKWRFQIVNEIKDNAMRQQMAVTEADIADCSEKWH